MDTINNIADRYKGRVKISTDNQPLILTPGKPLCPDCGGTGFVGYDVPVGHPKFGKIEPCQSPFHAEERLRRTAAISGLHEADLGKRLYHIKDVDGNLEMLVAANEFVDDPQGWLYIWGGPGNAKSETLIAIVNELNASGRGPAMYTTFTSLVNWMRDSFKERKVQEKDPDADLGYIQRFEQALKIKCLALDEMDKARDTEFSTEFRFHFLDERYRQAINGQTFTVFASNSNPNQLPEPLYDRVRDGRFKIVQNLAGSARPNMRRQQ